MLRPVNIQKVVADRERLTRDLVRRQAEAATATVAVPLLGQPRYRKLEVVEHADPLLGTLPDKISGGARAPQVQAAVNAALERRLEALRAREGPKTPAPAPQAEVPLAESPEAVLETLLVVENEMAANTLSERGVAAAQSIAQQLYAGTVQRPADLQQLSRRLIAVLREAARFLPPGQAPVTQPQMYLAQVQRALVRAADVVSALLKSTSLPASAKRALLAGLRRAGANRAPAFPAAAAPVPAAAAAAAPAVPAAPVAPVPAAQPVPEPPAPPQEPIPILAVGDLGPYPIPPLNTYGLAEVNVPDVAPQRDSIVSMNRIGQDYLLADFQGESGFNRFYDVHDYIGLAAHRNRVFGTRFENPATRAIVEPNQIRFVKAHLVPAGAGRSHSRRKLKLYLAPSLRRALGHS